MIKKLEKAFSNKLKTPLLPLNISSMNAVCQQSVPIAARVPQKMTGQNRPVISDFILILDLILVEMMLVPEFLCLRAPLFGVMYTLAAEMLAGLR